MSRAIRSKEIRHRLHPQPGSPGSGQSSAETVAVRVEGPPPGLDTVIGDCGVYEHGRRRPGRVPLDEAGEAARRTEGFVWIGLRQPTADDIAAVAARFALPPLAVQDAVTAHQRAKLEVYDDVVFVVLKPVDYLDGDELVEVSEIAVFVGAGFVVTVRHGATTVLARVRAELDAGPADLLAPGPAAVLYRAADLVVDGYEEAMDCIDVDVDEIEEQVFSDHEGDHAQRIYQLKREVAEFRRAVLPLGTPVHRLATGAVPGITEAAAPYFRHVHDHVLRTAEAIEAHDRLLTDVLQAHMSRLTLRQSQIALRQNEVTARQNEDMRKISAWAAIALVPTAVAGIYGMNFENMPELRWQSGYFLILGLIAAVCLGLYVLFRRNRWL